MGEWGRNEFAIIGTTCDKIQSIVHTVAGHLQPKFSVGYIDASHDELEETPVCFSTSTKHKSHWETHQKTIDNAYQSRIKYNDNQLLLINGNHFVAKRQIVFIDQVKKESLSKKLHKLNDIAIIVVAESSDEIYDFLQPHIKESTRIINHEDLSVLSKVLAEMIATNLKLTGLVLAGGKSTRMGFDKTTIEYFGQNQVEYIAGAMTKICHEVFVSQRQEQEVIFSHQRIEDRFIGMGPMGGILSAFMHNPNTAWFTVAADLPFANLASMQYLLDQRDPSKIATCYIKSDAQFPDPLFTIWEPHAYLHLLHFLSLGYSCPRKVLINSDVNVIPVPDDNYLMNVNDPESLAKAKKQILENSVQ